MYRHEQLRSVAKMYPWSEPKSRESWGILQATKNAREAESATQCNSTIRNYQLCIEPGIDQGKFALHLLSRNLTMVAEYRRPGGGDCWL